MITRRLSLPLLVLALPLALAPAGCVPGGAGGTANSPRFIAASAQPSPPPENIA